MIVRRIENGPFFVNTYLIGCEVTKKGILVDPGHEIDTITAAIEKSGLDIEAIVNTHGHIDHVASVHHFQTTRTIPFKLHAADAEFLDRLAEQCVMFGLPTIPKPTVDEWLEAGTTLTVGELSFELRHAPGHSPGSLVFRGAGESIVGDVVFEGSIGRTDLPLGDGATLLESIRREILSLPDDTRLHPGHGPATTVGRERAHNPFLK